MPISAEPTSVWLLDELSGNDRVDSLGGPSFVDADAGTPTASNATALFGRSADFTAKTAYLRMAATTSVNPQGTFSLAVGIRFANSNHQQAYLVAKRDFAGDVADRFWFIDHLDTTNAPERFRFVLRNSANSADQTVEFAHVPTDNAWILVIAKYDATAQVVGLSVNGSAFTTAAATGGIRTDAATIVTSLAKEGDAAVTANTGRGSQLLDHLMYWDGDALSDADASFLYNDGNWQDYPFSSPEAVVASVGDGSLGPGGRARIYNAIFLLGG